MSTRTDISTDQKATPGFCEGISEFCQFGTFNNLIIALIALRPRTSLRKHNILLYVGSKLLIRLCWALGAT